MRGFGLVVVLVLGSCGTLRKIEETGAILKDAATQVRMVARRARASADKNRDGVVSGAELAAWVAGGGGLALLGFMEALRRRMKRKIGELWRGKMDRAGGSSGGSVGV